MSYPGSEKKSQGDKEMMRKNPCYKLEQKLCGHEIGWRDRGKGERMALREREKIASKKIKIEKVE